MASAAAGDASAAAVAGTVPDAGTWLAAAEAAFPGESPARARQHPFAAAAVPVVAVLAELAVDAYPAASAETDLAQTDLGR